MKIKKTLKVASLLSFIILSGCKVNISEIDASETLSKNIKSEIYGVVSSASESKNYEFDLNINGVGVDFHEMKNFSDSTIVIHAKISIKDTIIQNKDAYITFSGRSYLDKSNFMVKISDLKLNDLKVSNVYSSYYSDFSLSLRSYIDNVLGDELSNISLNPKELNPKNQKLSLKMENIDDMLVIDIKKNK